MWSSSSLGSNSCAAPAPSTITTSSTSAKRLSPPLPPHVPISQPTTPCKKPRSPQLQMPATRSPNAFAQASLNKLFVRCYIYCSLLCLLHNAVSYVLQWVHHYLHLRRCLSGFLRIQMGKAMKLASARVTDCRSMSLCVADDETSGWKRRENCAGTLGGVRGCFSAQHITSGKTKNPLARTIDDHFQFVNYKLT